MPKARRSLITMSCLILLAVLAAGSTGAQTTEPQLSLKPSAGPAGSVVGASGMGFEQSPCGVSLFFDSPAGQPLGFASVQDGAFATDIIIPMDAALGEHTIIAVGLVVSGEFCGGPSGDEARALFTVVEESLGPFVGGPVTPISKDIDLRGLPTIPPWKEGDPVRVGPGQELPGEEELQIAGAVPGAIPPGSSVSSGTSPTSGGTKHHKQRHKRNRRARASHPVETFAATPLAGPFANFDGVPATGILPPDVSGDVGPNHFIQTVNTAFMVFDKQGNVLAGPSNINSLWSGIGGPCETNNDGDPDVRYDPVANRWVIGQFVAFTDFCIAVSRTPDPIAGGWYLYDFSTGGVANDYPKLAVWPDAFYAGSQRGYPGSGADAWAFDRANMLGGIPATFVRFFDPGTFLLPSDLDGATPPPAGAPNVFARPVDGAQFGGADRLELREFHVNFPVPALSTFTALPSLPTAPFDRNICGFGLFGVCIPQPGTAQLLSSFTAWPLARLQYRNLGAYETLVVDHTVDADGADHAGVRWYELRKSGGVWSIFQQGTHAPDLGAPGLADDPHRWMGSTAMDKNGNIAAGYSVSSSAVFPGLRYAGRLASDPAGTLPQGEATLIAGGGSQTHGSGRWGDYSSMTVDPVDDCTFWFTSEYYPFTSTAGWRTRIGSFRLDGTAPVVVCPANALVECSATGGTPKADPQLVGFFSGASATDDCDLTPTISDNAPVLFGLGATPVTFTGTDDNGNAGSCLASVTVADTTPPSITAPPDVTAECTSPSGASPPLGTPTASDVCDATPTVTNNAPPTFPLGMTTVTWKATDDSGNMGTDTQAVTVVDTAAPTLSVSLSPSVLWPPNHKLVTITATIAVSDVCDPAPTVRLVSITSNEPDDATGDGHTMGDVQGAAFGTDDRSFQLRAERSGNGNGRIYTITYVAQDASGNMTSKQATVLVPHDQGH